MGQNIVLIEHGSFSARLDTTETGRLNLSVSTSIHGGSTLTMELNELDVRAVQSSLAEWVESRETKFNVGDIVYEPDHYKRAGEVVSILDDRVYYGAPYRIKFIDQDPKQPTTDYFPADALVLVQRKGA